MKFGITITKIREFIFVDETGFGDYRLRYPPILICGEGYGEAGVHYISVSTKAVLTSLFSLMRLLARCVFVNC